MIFSEIFQDILLENNINIQELSRKTKIDDSTLYDYLQGALPTVKNAVVLANYFDCSLNYLMGLDDNPKDTKFNQDYDISLFSNRYDDLLNKSKISHYKISKEKGLNYSSHYSWQHGAIPKMSSLLIIATYFGVSLDFLVGRN